MHSGTERAGFRSVPEGFAPGSYAIHIESECYQILTTL